MDRPRSRLNTQIYEEASEWFVECRAEGVDESGRREFDRWLRKSPEHVSAYLEIAALWSEGRALDSSQKWDAESLILEARRDPENIVPLGAGQTEPHAPPPRSSEISTAPSRSRRWPIAIAACFFVVAAGLTTWYFFLRFPTYGTQIGEQRFIELADGSTVEMNSKSRIRVRYSEGQRAIDLLEGQALFHVAKNRARPFIVDADGTRVRAVGTQFDVYRRDGATTVTVLEGQVAVFAPEKVTLAQPAQPQPAPGEKSSPAPQAAGSSDGSLRQIPLSAGEQLMVTQNIARKSDHANVTAATAWTERRIVFESATLSQVAEEFNRYNERQLVIEDPDLYQFHISGVFSSTDPESLIRFLRERPGVMVTESASVIRVSKKSP